MGTRRSLRTQSKKHLHGLTLISPLKRKNSKKSKRLSKLLQCQFFNQWQVPQEEHQEVCQELEVCQILEEQLQEVLHQQMIQHLDQLLKKSTKRFEINIFLHTM